MSTLQKERIIELAQQIYQNIGSSYVMLDPECGKMVAQNKEEALEYTEKALELTRYLFYELS